MEVQTEGFSTNVLVKHVAKGLPKDTPLVVLPDDFENAFIARHEEAKDALINKTNGEIEASFTKDGLVRAEVEARHALLKSTLEDCLPFEKRTLQGRFQPLDQRINSCQRTRSRLNDEVERIDGYINGAKNVIQSVREQFPGVELLDLNCLHHFTLKNGLPRLGLLSVTHSDSMISMTIGSNVTYHGVRHEYLDNDIQSALTEKIMAATGVEILGHWDIRDKALERAKKQRKLPKDTKNFPSECKRIDLEGEFKDPVLTPEVRSLIKKALDSNLFEEVVLLTEVTEWKLSYYRESHHQKGEPFIQGEVITVPKRKDKDPLIIGIKNVETVGIDKTLAFVLGAFDTTPLEDWIKSELATPA